MSCLYGKLFDSLHEGKMDPSKEKQLLEHARNCSECSQKLKEIEEMDGMLTGAFEKYAFHSRKEEILRKAERKSTRVSILSMFYHSRRAALSICLAFAFIFSLYWFTPAVSRLTSSSGKNTPGQADAGKKNITLSAVYLVPDNGGELQKEELQKHPEIQVVHKFADLVKALKENPQAAIWIDKTAVDLLQDGWLQQAPQKFNLLLLIGYDNPETAFIDKLHLCSDGSKLNWQGTQVGEGFCAWLLNEKGVDMASFVCSAFSGVPCVEDIYKLAENAKAQAQQLKLQDVTLDSFIDSMKSLGHDVKGVEQAAKSAVLSALPRTITIDNFKVTVYVYADENTAKVQVDTLCNSTTVEVKDITHFYQKGNIIVTYEGQDTAALTTLRNTLGEALNKIKQGAGWSFAGLKPDAVERIEISSPLMGFTNSLANDQVAILINILNTVSADDIKECSGTTPDMGPITVSITLKSGKVLKLAVQGDGFVYSENAKDYQVHQPDMTKFCSGLLLGKK